MEILWGQKYRNYYWKCHACGKSEPTPSKCRECQNKLKMRKDGRKYFIYCEGCRMEWLYHDFG